MSITEPIGRSPRCTRSGITDRRSMAGPAPTTFRITRTVPPGRSIAAAGYLPRRSAGGQLTNGEAEVSVFVHHVTPKLRSDLRFKLLGGDDLPLRLGAH